MTAKNNDMYWLRSGIITVLQNITSVIFGFGSFYLLVRLLNQHDFGLWTLFMSVTTVLEIVRSGLVQSTLIKFLAGASRGDSAQIISSSLMITGILTISCIIINLSFASYLAYILKSPELESLFYVFNITFILSGALIILNSIEQANLNFTGTFASSFLRNGGFFVYIVYCFIFKVEVELINLLIVQTITVLTCTIVSYYYARKHLIISYKVYPQLIKQQINYGKYTFGTSISSILSVTIDQIMLGAIISPAASGAFNVAVRITNLIDIPTNAVAAIVFPQSAKRIKTEGKEAIKYLYERSVGILMAMLVPGVIFLFIFSEMIIDFLAGDKYNETIPILQVTLVYCLLKPYGRQFGTILDSIGKTRLTFFIVLIVASINISLNYVMIKEVGILGAAYASLIAEIIGFLIAKRVLEKELNINIFNTLIYAVKFYPELYYKYIKPKLNSQSVQERFK